VKAYKDQLVQLEKQWEKENADYFQKLRSLRTAIEERDNVRRSIPRVMVMEDMPTPRKTFMLDKGLYDKPQEEVTAATPVSLSALPTDAPRNRLALADWLVSKEQPLTPRVVVNRFWQQFFGIGIVKTPEDFGVQGERPKHPELLDWLAADFMEHGWSIKHIHRLILNSAAYQQSSAPRPEGLAVDAGSRWLWRFPSRRLEAEAIRDTILAVSGRLDARMGGPGFSFFEANDNYVRVYNPKKEFGPEDWRRMIYGAVVRQRPDGPRCPDCGRAFAGTRVRNVCLLWTARRRVLGRASKRV
jgi:hypothetical protein